MTRDIDAIIRQALNEDVGNGDITTLSTIDALTEGSGSFVSKASGTIAGTGIAARVFSQFDGPVSVHWNVKDGARVAIGDEIGSIRGNARAILTGERVALNILQRMSGIATATRVLVDAAHGYPAVILDTRKTVPGLRVLDRLAVLAGGGSNHRFGLYDMVLIKDNHIVAAGGIKVAIEKARAALLEMNASTMSIEVETATIREVAEVLQHWATTGDPDRIMLDNMATTAPDGTLNTAKLVEALRLIDGRVETEASGNVTPATVRKIAATGVDFISSGAVTHSVQALDISLLLTLGE